ncbi:putative uncharacterized protein ENSP00000383309 [Erythrolamprus reginae]|uniref:putative uncharacterized protein ENSP00000383309 n=1 Tax=Erythrolamprus reginae TaxID=121349 RepID=UPI00396D01F0
MLASPLRLRIRAVAQFAPLSCRKPFRMALLRSVGGCSQNGAAQRFRGSFAHTPPFAASSGFPSPVSALQGSPSPAAAIPALAAAAAAAAEVSAAFLAALQLIRAPALPASPSGGRRSPRASHSHRAKKIKDDHDATLEDFPFFPGAFPRLSPAPPPQPSPAQPGPPAGKLRGAAMQKAQSTCRRALYLLPPGESDRPGSSFSHGRLPRPCSSASLSSNRRRILELRRGGGGGGEVESSRARPCPAPVGGGFSARPVASTIPPRSPPERDAAPLSPAAADRSSSASASLSAAAVHIAVTSGNGRSDGVGSLGQALLFLTKAKAAAATQRSPDAPRPCLGCSDAPRPSFAARSSSQLHPRRGCRCCKSPKRRLPPPPPDRKPLASLPHEAFPRRRRRLLRSQKRARVAETGSVQRRPPGKGGISRGGQGGGASACLGRPSLRLAWNKNTRAGQTRRHSATSAFSWTRRSGARTPMTPMPLQAKLCLTSSPRRNMAERSCNLPGRFEAASNGDRRFDAWGSRKGTHERKAGLLDRLDRMDARWEAAFGAHSGSRPSAALGAPPVSGDAQDPALDQSDPRVQDASLAAGALRAPLGGRGTASNSVATSTDPMAAAMGAVPVGA